MRTLAAALLTLVVFSGCSPLTMSFTLFADEGRLKEATVESDPRAGSAKIVMIDVRGLIADGEDGGLFSSGPNKVDEFTARLTRAAADTSIKALILRINSPGGTVAASDMVYREIRAWSERTGRPVVASVGEIAASGGYYVALAADRIIAEPSSITGSIGVIIPTVNVSQGLNRIGIVSRSITSRPNKDLANPLAPMKEEHYAVLQALVDEFYAHFRALVVERRGGSRSLPDRAPARPLDSARIDELTDGRVVTGVKAAEAGLVDQTGGIREAFALAKSLAGIPAASLVKYYREDATRPRTPYAAAGPQAVPGESEINLFQLRLGRSLGSGSMQGPGVYYLWLPPD